MNVDVAVDGVRLHRTEQPRRLHLSVGGAPYESHARRHAHPEVHGDPGAIVLRVHGAHRRPTLVIADEPTANLDAASARRIMDVFLDFNRVGVTTLIASHDHQLMANYARRTMLIDNGRFVDFAGVHA